MHHKPNITQEEKLTRMTESPLPGLIFSLAVPTIVSMLISALYNMADTYFVGLIGNASATGAIGVVFPLMSLMQAIAFMFGHGSGNHMSRSLGAGDVDDAEKYASTGFFSALGAGVLLMVIGLVWTDPHCAPAGRHGDHCALCPGLCALSDARYAVPNRQLRAE